MYLLLVFLWATNGRRIVVFPWYPDTKKVKKIMSTLRRIVLAGLFSAGMCGTAFADSIENFTYSVPVEGYNTTAWSTTFDLETFDTTLGTLNSVSLSITDNLDAMINVTNNTGGSANYTASASVDSLFSTDPDLLSQNPNTFSVSPSSVSVFLSDELSQASGPFNISNGDGGTVEETLTGSNTTSGDPTTFVDQNSNLVFTLSDFESVGPGSLPIYEIVAGTFGCDGPSPSSCSGTAESSTTITVTYDYSPASVAPEPATMALVGGALIGLGLIGKKRFKKY